MQIDETTYSDLSVFQSSDEISLFSKLDRTRTVGGRLQLQEFFNNPFSELGKIKQIQEILGIILKYEDAWAPSISNGTIMVMERYYETPLDKIPSSHDPVSARMYQLLHAPDYALTRYSTGHFSEFIRGMLSITAIREKQTCPPILKNLMDQAHKLLNTAIIRSMAEKKSGDKLQPSEVVEYGNFIRNHFKPAAMELIRIYGKFDAWYSMALACKEFNFVMPEILETDYPILEVKSLCHPLFRKPFPIMFS